MKNSPEFKTHVVRCWIKNGWKHVTAYRKIKRGENKGKFQVIKINGRKCFVDEVRPVNNEAGSI